MPARRQQRRNSARGRAPFKTLATVPALIATLSAQNSNTIRLSFGTINPNVTLVGIPAMRRGLDDSTPLSVGWDGTLLSLVYASPNIGASETFTLDASDSAFRGSNGEFIGACSLVAAGAIPAPACALLTPGQPCAIGVSNCATGDNLTCPAPPGPNIGDVFLAANPASFTTGLTITGVASGGFLAAGEVRSFTWDGSAWNP